MQANRILGMALVILSLGAGLAWAGSTERLGTGGASELRIPVGARSVALAGADLAMVGGAEALFYNPAGVVAGEHKTEAVFSHTQYIADMQVNYFGLVQEVAGFGHVGVSAKVLSVGDIVHTTESAPDGTGDVFSPTFSTIGVTYGKRMTDRVNFGGTVYYIAERVLQTTGSGVAFDFGFQYDTGWRGIRVGMAMKSFGPNMSFGGSDFDRIIQLPGDDPQASGRNVQQSSSAFELPSTFQMSAGVPLIQGPSPLTVFGAFNSNSFGRDDGRLGAEWTVRKVLTLRGGYRYNGESEELFQWSYGAGVIVPLAGTQVVVDYAGQPVKGGFFDDVQMVSVGFHF